MKLITLIFLLFSLHSFATPCDSIGVRSKDGQSYILHKVEAKETLYGLSRHYGATVSEIETANDIKGGLSVGQVVWVPTKQKIESQKEETKLHTVTAGQTLYAISRLHQVSVADIKLWNKMTSNELSIGENIIVGKVTGKEEVSTDKPEVEKKKASNVKTRIKKKVILKPTISKRTHPQQQVGKVVLGSTEELQHKFSYCLHPTAPIGTIIVLTCKTNDRVILVKVIGNTVLLDGIILHVNQSVFNSLSIDNTTFEAEINYLD